MPEAVAPRDNTARVNFFFLRVLLSRFMLLKLSVRMVRSSSIGLSSHASPKAVSSGRMDPYTAAGLMKFNAAA